MLLNCCFSACVSELSCNLLSQFPRRKKFFLLLLLTFLLLLSIFHLSKLVYNFRVRCEMLFIIIQKEEIFNFNTVLFSSSFTGSPEGEGGETRVTLHAGKKGRGGGGGEKTAVFVVERKNKN